MTAKEFYENDKKHLFSDQKENDYKNAIIGLMQDYHEQKLKILNIPVVNGCAFPNDRKIGEFADKYRLNNTVNKMGIERTAFIKGAEWMRDIIKQHCR